MASAGPKYPHSSMWPTRQQYLWLLRSEAAHKGLLFTAKELEDWPGPITDEEVEEMFGPQSDTCLTPDQWLDVTSSGPISQESRSPERFGQGTDYTQITDSVERQSLVRTYAWLYLDDIQQNVDKRLLEAGATKSQHPRPEEAILHDLGTLWAATVEKPPVQIPQAHFSVFSDIPQEETTTGHIHIPYDLSFSAFQSQVAALGIVRHLTTKHHPSLAESLFLDDSLVYHHPYPTALDLKFPASPSSSSSIKHPLPEIHPQTRDYTTPHNGWASHVVPRHRATMLCEPTNTQLCEPTDWRPLHTEADWQALLRLHRSSNRKVFLRHWSVVDRMEFVGRQREREEREQKETGGRYLNLFLERHVEEFWGGGGGKVNAPAHPDQNVSREEWLRRVIDRQRREGEVMEDEVQFFQRL